MCTVPAIVGVGIGLNAAGTAMSLTQQSLNRDALQEHQRNLHEANKRAASMAAIRDFDILQRRRMEESEAAALRIQAATRQAAAATSRARLAATEAGVGGQSVRALLGSFAQQEIEFRSAVLRQEDFRRAQLTDSMAAIRSRQYSRILSSLPQPVPRPDFIGGVTDFLGESASLFLIGLRQ